MTQVRIAVSVEGTEGALIPARGRYDRVTFMPSRRRVTTGDAPEIVLPSEVVVDLAAANPVTVDLSPSDGTTWYWSVVEKVARADGSKTAAYAITIPDSADVLELAEIAHINTETFEPIADHPTIAEELDALDAAKANVDHTHVMADVTGLQSALDAKATEEALNTEAVARVALANSLPGIFLAKSDTSVVKRVGPNQVVNFDVPQGLNDGTLLPFTSRVIDTNGNPVLEQINAKPTTDLSEGVIDWQHNSTFGDLLHLTAGPGMTDASNSAALIAMGLDNGYPVGLFINNKGTAARGIGIKIVQNASINSATGAYGLEIDQKSPTSPAMQLWHRDGAATLMRLQADSSIASTRQALIEVLAAGAQKGIVRAKTGEIYWLANVIAHDGAGFLNIATGVSADSDMTNQLADGYHIRKFSGTAGIYYPARTARSSSGLTLDVGSNTSGGPNWTGVTWQTGVTVRPGSTKARVLLGAASPGTTETQGFPYIPVMAGTPSGAPTAETGFAPIVADSTGSKLWVYINSAWKAATLV